MNKKDIDLMQKTLYKQKFSAGLDSIDFETMEVECKAINEKLEQDFTSIHDCKKWLLSRSADFWVTCFIFFSEYFLRNQCHVTITPK